MQRHWENCTAVSTMCGAGILYDEQTPQALAATIRHGLHVDPEDIARLVTNGHAWLAGNCDARGYGAAITRILRETCSGAGKKSSDGTALPLPPP
jgi:hypothetical protein